jgi:hypothetical protein
VVRQRWVRPPPSLNIFLTECITQLFTPMYLVIAQKP